MYSRSPGRRRTPGRADVRAGRRAQARVVVEGLGRGIVLDAPLQHVARFYVVAVRAGPFRLSHLVLRVVPSRRQCAARARRRTPCTSAGSLRFPWCCGAAVRTAPRQGRVPAAGRQRATDRSRRGAHSGPAARVARARACVCVRVQPRRSQAVAGGPRLVSHDAIGSLGADHRQRGESVRSAGLGPGRFDAILKQRLVHSPRVAGHQLEQFDSEGIGAFHHATFHAFSP